MVDRLKVQPRNELCTASSLHAVVRPSDLLYSVERKHVADLNTFVLTGETSVRGWMPILSCNDQIELGHQLVGNRDDFVAVGHCQRAARNKVVLNVDKD